MVDGHTLSIQYALLFVFRTTRRGFLNDNTSILNKIGVFTKEVVTVSKYSKDNSPIFEKTVRESIVTPIFKNKRYYFQNFLTDTPFPSENPVYL